MQINPIEQARLQAAQSAQRGTAVHAQALDKSFGARQVLRGVDLTIEAGEFVVVIGHSGCGKSTLLRLLAGLESPDAGTVRFGEGEVFPETRVMFQDSRLLPWKRVEENVALGLPRGRDVGPALRQVGLEDRAREWPAVLSGGQRQRVALARALVHDPQLLLLDEPLGALDALTRIEMQQMIENLWLARGFTALLVTHDVQEAVALADRVVLIEDGCITLDCKIDLPRPRARGNPRFAELEEKILARVLQPVPAHAA
ncbi:MAG: ATP-binding cassette domain-containing protein [Pseudomonadota bacterium]